MIDTLSFIQSRNAHEYQPLIARLGEELGPSFPRSIRNWCGVGHRPYQLADWEIFLAESQGVAHCRRAIVGLCSHYRQPGDPQQRYWIGWIGVLQEYRRGGVGTRLLSFIETRLRNHYRTSECWVYTDSQAAVTFYEVNGYHRAGLFGEIHLTQSAATDGSIVLYKSL